MQEILSAADFIAICHSPHAMEDHSVAAGCNLLAIDLSSPDNLPALQSLPRTTIIGIAPRADLVPSKAPWQWVDIVVADQQELTELRDKIQDQAQAAHILCQILRLNEHAELQQGLLNESLGYTTLQQSHGFKGWLTQQTKSIHRTSPEPLLTCRESNKLVLTLNRPEVHNAYDMALKDALCSALLVAHVDTSITELELCGEGASFSAGGDLSEFGKVEDAAVSHLSRTTRSAAWLLGSLPCDSTSFVHGACVGAGIELPAFTRHITAHPSSFFQLPEVAMGLIPGAGGTVSITRRIGRHRTALMAISNQRINADTALSWGLVDTISG